MNLETTPFLQKLAAVLFALALAHTFSAKQFERLAARSPRHSGLFHLLGEVEVVFGFWAFVLVACMALFASGDDAIAYAESRNYTEPLFVFVVMVIAASGPILQAIETSIRKLARVLPGSAPAASVWLSFAAVPLFGSLVTEPAAMTIAALMLAPQVFRPDIPERLKYFSLGVLFVNVSIGGTLTSYAAPPVLMVATTWGWDSTFMLTNFGWKAAAVVLINATVATFSLRGHLHHAELDGAPRTSVAAPIPITVVLVHAMFVVSVVIFAHHPVIFLGVFLMFLGFTQAYERHQSPLIVKEALLVGFFLAGLVLLGGMQQWWLQPIVAGLEPLALFVGALGLTAITDNAALTYLGSLIAGISMKQSTCWSLAPSPEGVSL